jgi:protease-4
MSSIILASKEIVNNLNTGIDNLKMNTLLNRISVSVLITSIAFVTSGCLTIQVPINPQSGQLEQRTITSAGFGSAGKAVLIDISGIIGLDAGSSFFGDELDMITMVSETLDLAVKDNSVTDLILRIDSPGGGVTASDIIFNEIMDFRRERPEVRVYANMLGTAASGGYYIAMAAHEVSSHPTTITGSIGVIASFPLIKGLSEKIGYDMRVIKSGENKDIGSVFKDFTPEQQKILQATIDTMYLRFLQVVKQGRPGLSVARVRELADGRIFTAQEARQTGLIDRIEYLPDLIERIEEKAGGEIDLVSYHPFFDMGSSVYATRSNVASGHRAGKGLASTPAIPSKITMEHQIAGFPSALKPGFYYLWME